MNIINQSPFEIAVLFVEYCKAKKRTSILSTNVHLKNMGWIHCDLNKKIQDIVCSDYNDGSLNFESDGIKYIVHGMVFRSENESESEEEFNIIINENEFLLYLSKFIECIQSSNTNVVFVNNRKEYEIHMKELINILQKQL